jgi:HEAT repeat protein
MMDVNNAGRAIVDLGNLHRDPGVAIPALLQALQSSDSYIRASAATALGKFAGEARTAMPALQKALEDPDSPVRRQAGAALKLIDS